MSKQNMVGQPRAEAIPILLTSAVRPTAPLTGMSDIQARLAATIQALVAWMSICPRNHFVLCDGSDFDLTAELRTVRGIDQERLEIVTFLNDQHHVRAKGKGFGEGEIIKYALAHSSKLKSADSFAKCTGKLWVENFAACAKAYNGMAGFSYFGFLRVLAVDTRFYIVQRSFYESKLLECHTHCDDPRGIYLENVFYGSLMDMERRAWMLPVYPTVCGISGTSGTEDRSGLIKRLGKNLAIQVLRRTL